MDMRREEGGQIQKKWGNLLENLAIVLMMFYPLRHIGWGLDLADTGYSYANFQYMGTEHMDSMWLFSTYLTNAAGNLLTKLPRADTLMGMNLYTGLSASILALTGYFFCTRKLKMPKAIAFAGEMTALSLCWCPTATLYNYLTYLFFLISSVLLYLGLTMDEKHCTEKGRFMEGKHSRDKNRSMEERISRKKKGYLMGAGAFLGANVLVRFSNLPEMGMILAVWVYDMICTLEERADYKRKTEPVTKGRADTKGKAGAAGEAGEAGNLPEGFWKRTGRHTLWCLAGYLGVLAVLLGYIHIRYGSGEYLAGIARLFAMTDNATDYKPTSMVMGIIRWYWQEMYWVIRIGAILAGGMVLFAIAGWLEGILARRFPGKGLGIASDTAGDAARAVAGGSEPRRLLKPFLQRQDLPGIAGALFIAVRIVWTGVCIAMIVWLCVRGFTSPFYYSYDPIWHPGPVFMMLAMLIALIRIFHKGAQKEEKLISGMVILIILLTSIGSNNGVLPSLNNLFAAAPYTLWQSWRFLKTGGERRLRRGLVVSSFPAKGVLAAFLALCLFQFGAFGLFFAFAEGTGIQNPVAVVENNGVLRNIKMSPQKARWMEELSAYANENGLQGQEVILYGNIPAISYYLQMPSAFNPWSDLDSYSPENMERELKQLGGEISEKGKDKPVVILENIYGLYEEGGMEEQDAPGASEGDGAESQDASGASEGDGAKGQGAYGASEGDGAESQGASELSAEKRQKLDADPKWRLLLEFMEAFGYEQTFRNEKFAVYR